jgi:hypothetical protein
MFTPQDGQQMPAARTSSLGSVTRGRFVTALAAEAAAVQSWQAPQ